jgi:hypothetical protein
VINPSRSVEIKFGVEVEVGGTKQAEGRRCLTAPPLT